MAHPHQARIATVFQAEPQPQGQAGHTNESTAVQSMDLRLSAERQALRDKEGSCCSKNDLRKQIHKTAK